MDNTSRNDTTAAIIDGLLKLAMGGTVIGVAILAPNAVQIFGKPLNRYFKRFDARAREREFRRITSYMRRQGLVRGSYEHGLAITEAGRKRAEKADFDNLSIAKPKKWDKKWRLVMFDIPQTHKRGRDYLTSKLKALGFRQLQQSVWVYPFMCREEVEMVSLVFDVSRYVTYIETSHIDHQDKLLERFPRRLIK